MGTSYNPKIVTDGLVLNLDPANVKSYPANQDPFVNNVSLMLSMDGANNSTTFTDSSQNALAVTAVGSAKISTAQSKFGGASGYYDGSTGYLSLTGNSSFQFGTGDFTIEAWVYISANVANQQTFLDTRGTATAIPCTFGIYQSKLAFYDGTMRQSSATITTGQWYHFAACRSSGTLWLFIDGISYYSASNLTNITTGANSIYIGRGFDTAAYYTNGYIDDLRVTKYARYTSNFTPPSAPFSLPGRLTDLTKNKISSTLTNTTFTSSNGGLLTYNGSSSTTVGSSAITGVSEFTVMVWFNSSSIVNYKNVLDFNYNFNGTGSSNTGPRLEMSSAGDLIWVFSGSSTNAATINSTIAAKSSSLQTNTWYCAVVTRDNSLNVKAYLNGVDSGNSVIQIGGNNSAFIGSFNKITIGVGCYPYSDRYLSGYVSIILAYNRALTAAEVFQNYNATKGRFGL